MMGASTANFIKSSSCHCFVAAFGANDQYFLGESLVQPGLQDYACLQGLPEPDLICDEPADRSCGVHVLLPEPLLVGPEARWDGGNCAVRVLSQGLSDV